jgi:hypothetical protein
VSHNGSNGDWNGPDQMTSNFFACFSLVDKILLVPTFFVPGRVIIDLSRVIVHPSRDETSYDGQSATQITATITSVITTTQASPVHQVSELVATIAFPAFLEVVVVRD